MNDVTLDGDLLFVLRFQLGLMLHLYGNELKLSVENGLEC
jgi:hypothetical protein